MSKRTITDEEVGLVKAMLARGMKNSEIQFFFNRPDRPVNSGRISGIRDGTYGNAKAIKRATDLELDRFLTSQAPPEKTRAVFVPSAAAPSDPLSAAALEELFEEGSDGFIRLAVGETDRHECKSNFGFKHSDRWLRAIAALANNLGGYVFFGVLDKDAKGPEGEDWGLRVAGLSSNEFEAADPADFAKRVKATFDPTPTFRTQVVEAQGQRFGVIYVDPHPSRPVIATKSEGSIKEGDIFFRYPGQSTRVKYSDLRAMLDARDAQTRSQLLPMVEKLISLGPDRSFIADLENGHLSDANSTIKIDEELIDKLNFIKEGQFDEVLGAPTLRLVGDLEASTSSPQWKTKLGLITRSDLLEAFFNQTKPDDPKLYLTFALEGGQTEWLPLHYFSGLAGMSLKDLEEFIMATKASPKRKKTYVARVQPDAAFHKATGTPKLRLKDLLAGVLEAPTTALEASHTVQAIQGLPSNAKFDVNSMMDILRASVVLLEGKSTASFARRAISRVDEILFSQK